jgi:subtilase family serine protease
MKIKKTSDLVARIVCAMAIFFSFNHFSLAADLKFLSGHVPQIVSQLTATGELPATNEMRLAIGIAPRDSAGLEKFLAELYDPANTNFHKFLTPEKFTEKFGPTKDDYQRVMDFAQTNGLKISAQHGNRIVLDVTGPASSVEKIFHIKLRTYKHPTEARNFFSPDTEPQVDTNLPIVDVIGLENYTRPHPKFHRKDAALMAVTPHSGSGPGGTYMGNDFRAAYVPDTTLTGAGQSVGLLEFDGFYPGDITTYENAAGLPAVPVQTVLLDGYSGSPGINDGNDEVSLDIEMAIAMAPGLTQVVSFEGLYQNDVLSSMVASNSIKNFSCSWGWGGGPSTTTDNIFKQMAAQGQTFFNASGDSDAFTSGQVDNVGQANAPSSCPYITQVGGTTLAMSSGAWSSETVWNWGGGTGSSGGISSYYSIPSWQTNINMSANGGSTTKRNIPDVAMIADDVYVNYGNGNSEVLGGTSCAAPLWAGFMALVNQQSVASSKSTLGFVNPAIYALGANPNYNSLFHDTTTGNNTWKQSSSLFYAMSGYDLCTGWGTPAGQNLINALAGSVNSLAISAANGFNASGPMSGPFNISSATFSLSNNGNNDLIWSLINTSAWLNASLVSDTLSAGATDSVTISLTGAASTLAIGTYTANLIFSNVNSAATLNLPFTLQIFQPLVVTPTNGFVASGLDAFSLSPTSQNLLLTNAGLATINWTLVNLPSWLNVSATSGSLDFGAQTTVTISLADAVTNFSSGIYTATVLLTNQNGIVAHLPYSVQIGQSLQNGGFETGDFSGWNLSGSSSIVSTNAGYFHSGQYGARLRQYPSAGSLSQTLATSPGQKYLLSFWLANPTNAIGATPNTFSAQWNGSTIYSRNNIPFSGWTNLNFTVTASNANTLLKFTFTDHPYYLALDDVNLTAIPSPSFQSSAPSAANFQMVWSTTPNVNYQVQYKTNLFQTNWITLGNTVLSVTNILLLTDTNAFNLSPQRFYRLVVP